MGEGAYTILHELGTGTWGTVYEAELTSPSDNSTRPERVALKVLHPVWERHQEAALAVEQDLARLRVLDHANIVRTSGLVVVAGRQALVMELVGGLDLGSMVRQLRAEDELFPARAALELCAAVARALDGAHSRGVIHRGLKPANVMLGPDAHVRVLDFGTARDEFEEAEAFTQSVRYGSLRYREPERRHGGTAGTAGDVYALGCVLYELLARRPFGNAELTADKHTERIEAAVAKLPVGDDRFAALLVSMLAHDPEARPNPAEVVEQAEALIPEMNDDNLVRAASRFVPQAAEFFDETTNIERKRKSGEAQPSAAAPSAAPAPAWVVAIATLMLALAIGLVAFGS